MSAARPPLTLPIPTEALRDGLPHRPPMVWVSEVTQVLNGGECRVTLQPGALYLGPNGLRRSSLIEFIAQAQGFLAAARAISAATTAATAQRALIAAVKNAVFFPATDAEQVAPGAVLIVTLSQERRLGDLVTCSGEVRTHNGQLLARARLTLATDHS